MGQRENVQNYLYKLIHGEQSGIAAAVILFILRLLSYIYGLGVAVNLGLYKYGLLAQRKLPCRVISLGNITVGGTGKTPTAQLLAATIRDAGFRVAILNRGYRANWRGEVGIVSDGRKIYMSVSEAGDEAYLLAKSLPGVAVVIGKDRTITGNYAVEKLKTEVIIMDDGYQHWQLARDLDIVLIDTINVFGNSYLLPRGTLREPLANLDRAHVFLLTKVDQSKDDTREEIRDVLRRYNSRAMIAESIHNPRYFIEIEDWYRDSRLHIIPFETVRGKKVMAFSAIGNPSSFEQTIADIGAELVSSVRYPDHYGYTMAKMHDIMQKAAEIGNIEALVTTEKDAVKIPSEFIHSDRTIPVYVLRIEVKFVDGEKELIGLIRRTFADSQDKGERSR